MASAVVESPATPQTPCLSGSRWCERGRAFFGRRETMSEDRIATEQDQEAFAIEAMIDTREKVWTPTGELGGQPRLRVRTIERTALVSFVNALNLFEEASVRAVSDQLHRLVD